MKYAAVYLPSTSDDYDPTKIGFKSRNAAVRYVNRHCCKTCRRDYRHPYQCSPCGAEWLVMPERKFLVADGVGELLEAAGYVRVVPIP